MIIVIFIIRFVFTWINYCQLFTHVSFPNVLIADTVIGLYKEHDLTRFDSIMLTEQNKFNTATAFKF